MLLSQNVEEFLRRFFLNPFMLKVLLVINILGSLYGYYWYGDQLANTPLIYWIFTPDSPLASTYFAIALYYMLKKKEVSFLYFLSFATLIKYGLWAVFVNTHYWFASGQIHWLEVMLWVSHLGMAVEGFIYLLLFPPGRSSWAGVVLWLAISDYVDYSWDLHPYLYLERQLATVEIFTYFLSGIIIFSSALLLFRADKRK